MYHGSQIFAALFTGSGLSTFPPGIPRGTTSKRIVFYKNEIDFDVVPESMLVEVALSLYVHTLHMQKIYTQQIYIYIYIQTYVDIYYIYIYICVCVCTSF